MVNYIEWEWQTMEDDTQLEIIEKKHHPSYVGIPSIRNEVYSPSLVDRDFASHFNILSLVKIILAFKYINDILDTDVCVLHIFVIE